MKRIDKWWINENRKIKDVTKKLDKDLQTGDRYERDSSYSLDSFPPEQSLAYREAKKRYSIQTLSIEESGKAIRLIMGELGKKPDLHYNSTQGGGKMNYRNVIWGVNVEDGIEVCNKLVAMGIKEFKITPNNWLSIRIPREAQVSWFYRSHDVNVWKQKYIDVGGI